MTNKTQRLVEWNASEGGRVQISYFWKGRVALYAILEALGIGSGDEIIVPGFTCVVVPQAVRFRGARPVYVDIDVKTLNLDPEQLDAAISSRTKAIIVQHTFGLPADIESVKAKVIPRGIKVIEDCAHTLDSVYQGKKVGTLGDAAFFSTQWSKPFTTGLGGIAVTSDAELGTRLGQLEQKYQFPSAKESLVLRLQLSLHRALFRPSLYWTARAALNTLSGLGLFIGSSSVQELWSDKPSDYEKRMASFQVKAVKQGLAHRDENAAHRRKLTRTYMNLAQALSLSTISIPRDADPVMLRYPVLVSHRDQVLEQAQWQRVEIGDWFVSPLHPLLEGWEELGYRPGQCPAAESAAKEIINLPTHPKVDPSALDRICDFLQSMNRQGLLN